MIQDSDTNVFFGTVASFLLVFFCIALAIEAAHPDSWVPEDKKDEMAEAIQQAIRKANEPENYYLHSMIKIKVEEAYTEVRPKGIHDFYVSIGSGLLILLLVVLYLILWYLNEYLPDVVNNKIKLKELAVKNKAEIEKIKAQAEAEAKIKFADPNYSPRNDQEG